MGSVESVAERIRATGWLGSICRAGALFAISTFPGRSPPAE
jgi:hypothetical protein